MALTDKLKSIADAIRDKTGKTEEMTLDQMPGEIEGIETGGGGFDFLHTVEITEPVQVVQFDWNPAWNEYMYFYVVPENVQMSATEWLCFNLWGSNINKPIASQYIGTTGGQGANLFTEGHTSQVFVFHNGNGYRFSHNTPLTNLGSIDDFMTISFSTYYAQNTMNSGKIHIYGGK